MSLKKVQLQYPDFWKRMQRATKQVKHWPCWEKGTPKNIRPSHLTQIIEIGNHAVEISTTCHYCGQKLTVKEIRRALKKFTQSRRLIQIKGQ